MRLKTSWPILSASECRPYWKLWVGSRSKSFIIGTRWVVPICDIWFCLGSSSTTSLECFLPTSFNVFASAGLFVLVVTVSQRATMALIPLSAKTPPIPPRPACLYLARLRFRSYQVKFRHPIRVFLAPGPVETTEILRGFPLAKSFVNIAERV